MDERLSRGDLKQVPAALQCGFGSTEEPSVHFQPTFGPN